MRRRGRGRDYDCILGLSGGVDSSYVALKLAEWKLRPLAVQFDNGWNTELATRNIQSICSRLKIDLYTQVVNWPEFRGLQLAFFKAGLANLEAPSDHGIFAAIYRTAVQKRIPYLVTGVNYATEYANPLTSAPRCIFSHGYYYGDLFHLKAVHRRFGSRKLKTFPTLGVMRRLWIETFRLKRFDPLNLMDYDKTAAIRELQEKVDWRPYPGKHFESVITRFHQAYILPRKFGVDKRRLHLSNLIWSGQLTRAEALAELSLPACSDELLRQDRDFFIKKLEISEAEFETIMAAPPISYDHYPHMLWLIRLLPRLVQPLRMMRRAFRAPGRERLPE
jgi:N-acetyl sugar amidotransferase